MKALVAVVALAANALAPVRDLGVTFQPEQWSRLMAGDPVVNVFQEQDRTEVLTLAAVGVTASPAALVACARDPSCLRLQEETEQAARLPRQPSARDFEPLQLPESMVKRLQECRVARCGVRLARADIERLESVRWSEPDAAESAESVLREALAARAASYEASGNGGLVVFADRPSPVSSAESTLVLLSRPLPVLDAVPALRQRVVDGLAGQPAAPVVDEYMSWFRERAFRRQLLGMHHVVVAHLAAGGGDLAVVLSKQVYASSFTNSSLEVTALVRAEGASQGVLLWASRSRTDIRASGFNFAERLLLRRFVGGRVAGRLRALKARLEQ